MWYDKSMPQAQAILNRWYWNLHNMFQYFTNKTIVIKQKLKPRPYSYNSLR
jgi:1,2-phenylacetyl-CoA epoxidase catalytic subunit